MSYVESGLLTLLETLCLNPSSTTSCLWDLSHLVLVSLSLHICKVGRVLPSLFTAQVNPVLV